MSSVPVVAPLSSSMWVHTPGFTLPCTSSYQVTRTRDMYTLQRASVTEPRLSQQQQYELSHTERQGEGAQVRKSFSNA
jgi:hypothetical protein